MFLTLRRFLLTPLIDLLPSSCFAYRRVILRLMGVTLAHTARINAGFRVYGSGSLYIEDNVWIGRNCHFYTIGNSNITIGKSCEIGPECAFNCQSHKIGKAADRAGDCIIHDLSVGSGCWLGMRVSVLCNTIGSGCVIGAGALVLHDVKDNVLCAGVPAQEKKVLPE
ncbi:MAG: acyltransferase [Treponema sp.]|nr:acyltransferase [Treponema sp.]